MILAKVVIDAIHVAAVAETAFVALYVTAPWWRSWVGRALLTKSVGLMLVLDLAVIGYHLHYRYPAWVQAGVYVLVTVGIVGQLATLAWERWHGRRQS